MMVAVLFYETVPMRQSDGPVGYSGEQDKFLCRGCVEVHWRHRCLVVGSCVEHCGSLRMFRMHEHGIGLALVIVFVCWPYRIGRGE